MQFAEIPEHHIFKNTLLRTVNMCHVAHTQLFIGPAGSANLALALAFATYLNCAMPTEDDACGSCFSCTSMEGLVHPDFQLVFPRKPSSSISENQTNTRDLVIFRNCLKENPFLILEEWAARMDYDGRQFQITRQDVNSIIQRLGLKVFAGKYKVVLIWLPEYINNVAANALLKTLEEPPMDTVFLLVSCDGEKILPTIRSRSQQKNIPSFSKKAIQQILHNKYRDLGVDQYEEISFLAEGNVYRAFQLVEQVVSDNFEQFSSWMRSCYSNNYAKLIAQSEVFHKLSLDRQKLFFSYALQLIRVTLLGKLDYCIFQKVLNNEETFSRKFGSIVTISQLKEMVVLLTQAYYYLERNANAKMVYANLSIQISKTFKIVEKDLLVQQAL